ncbi:3-keto-5-aminohexanoate cleavage protein [Mesorhizobium caraganae]|uniref:3-keto-5-aminohexanoate cleavage protein n=1 Tax=Mesorhizobium caraganae TaxID=483206 RepID=UPI001784FFE5|nr:3-keto-5-aminohexanoate cleavage protein [Mesorhizobium caraganae]
MPLSINREVFITCAVTGAADTASTSRNVPRSPKEIATAAVEAAKAGAAVVHIHVRDPETGAPSNNHDLYKEVTDRIRQADTDVVLNITSGMGGDLLLGSVEQPLPLDPRTDLLGVTERFAHIVKCAPEICTLDCGTMNFNAGNLIMTNSPATLRVLSKMMTDFGVRPEIEVFDTGQLWFAKQLVEEGLIEDPVLVQLCMGVPWGAPNDLLTFATMVNSIPPNWTFSAFGIGRDAMAYPPAAVLAGGNVRVGLEDNLYTAKGQFATNGQLVEKAVNIVENMGARIIGPEEVRRKLELTKR